jgi:hypothetical protein
MIGKAINPDISVSVHRSLRTSVEGSVCLWSGVIQVPGIFHSKEQQALPKNGRTCTEILLLASGRFLKTGAVNRYNVRAV